MNNIYYTISLISNSLQHEKYEYNRGPTDCKGVWTKSDVHLGHKIEVNQSGSRGVGIEKGSKLKGQNQERENLKPYFGGLKFPLVSPRQSQRQVAEFFMIKYSSSRLTLAKHKEAIASLKHLSTKNVSSIRFTLFICMLKWPFLKS